MFEVEGTKQNRDFLEVGGPWSL